MWTVYILKSETDGSFYYGSTSDQPTRMQAHNAGKVRSTKAKRPWKILYTEQYSTHQEALIRERFFKTRAGWRWLKQMKII
ncbi:MAG: GIY-YIG nuclease family protein [Verrucomicrobia bacterium]|nr:GIY-YIG nuclease family protein [Verrucomicrobiota bacterium]MCG2679999.1 GIY-YIG nuclease family protein [Kiritimatiellia bacterium]MBU4247384.1 GIY-YIG nuclease family protein [Verrucomicrobiota bacterium]MBU4290633.1 GIY-YIG nuclease family protein [Verrucomicrobiota bacterium]MBU4429206.1 GIY-YIG nuclease family protein [Verrucomicrobiota bacterium]